MGVPFGYKTRPRMRCRLRSLNFWDIPSRKSLNDTPALIRQMAWRVTPYSSAILLVLRLSAWIARTWASVSLCFGKLKFSLGFNELGLRQVKGDTGRLNILYRSEVPDCRRSGW